MYRFLFSEENRSEPISTALQCPDDPSVLRWSWPMSKNSFERAWLFWGNQHQLSNRRKQILHFDLNPKARSDNGWGKWRVFIVSFSNTINKNLSTIVASFFLKIHLHKQFPNMNLTLCKIHVNDSSERKENPDSSIELSSIGWLLFFFVFVDCYMSNLIDGRSFILLPLRSFSTDISLTVKW